ncbi:MAG: hypothetical protein AAF543_06435, partial [Pseudomonadota bacterium]
LHEPYYESNPHHAIVVGRRLPEDQATRLRDYVVELGMADDAYLWALPYDGVGPADGSEDDGLVGERSEQEDRLEQLGRDLTGLN